MRAVDIIMKKRGSILNPKGSELSKEELDFLINGYVKGDIPDYQISSWLMAVYFNGMTFAETGLLTEIMLHSGDVIDLSGLTGPFVDNLKAHALDPLALYDPGGKGRQAIALAYGRGHQRTLHRSAKYAVKIHPTISRTPPSWRGSNIIPHSEGNVKGHLFCRKTPRKRIPGRFEGSSFTSLH